MLRYLVMLSAIMGLSQVASAGCVIDTENNEFCVGDTVKIRAGLNGWDDGHSIGKILSGSGSTVTVLWQSGVIKNHAIKLLAKEIPILKSAYGTFTAGTRFMLNNQVFSRDPRTVAKVFTDETLIGIDVTNTGKVYMASFAAPEVKSLPNVNFYPGSHIMDRVYGTYRFTVITMYKNREIFVVDSRGTTWVVLADGYISAP